MTPGQQFKKLLIAQMEKDMEKDMEKKVRAVCGSAKLNKKICKNCYHAEPHEPEQSFPGECTDEGICARTGETVCCHVLFDDM